MTESADREQIYLDYRDKIMGYLHTHVGNHEDAEDLCSSIFLKIYSRLDTYQPSASSLSTWIYSITRNSVIDYYRTRHVHSPIEEDIPATDELDESMLQEETLQELAAGLKHLPKELSDLIILHYYKNYTLQKIAEFMNLSYGAVKLRHKKALELLRKSMNHPAAAPQ